MTCLSRAATILNYAQIVPDFNSGTGDNTRDGLGTCFRDQYRAKQLNVGGTEYGVGYYIDGLNNNDNWVEGPVTNVNMDTMQEVKAEVVKLLGGIRPRRRPNQRDHEVGHQRPPWNSVRLFPEFGNERQRSLFGGTGVPRKAYHQNQYGFTVGGPVYIPKFSTARTRCSSSHRSSGCATAGRANCWRTFQPMQKATGDFSGWLPRISVDAASVRRYVQRPSPTAVT